MSATNAKKRKLSSSDGASSSKRTTKSGATEGASPLQARINALQKALGASSDLNPLGELLELVRDLASSSEVAPVPANSADASRALYRGMHIVVRALRVLCDDGRVPVGSIDEEGRATGGEAAAGADESAREVRKWLRERWNEAVGLLCALLGDEREEIRTTSVKLLLDLQKAASTSLSHTKTGTSVSTPAGPPVLGQWAPTPWLALTLALVAGPPIIDSYSSFARGGSNAALVRSTIAVPQDVRAIFAESYLESYDDVRFSFCRAISGVLSQPPPSAAGNDALRSNALALLVLLTAIPTQQADLDAFWVPGLAVPPPKSTDSGKKTKGKKAQKQKVTQDGDSEGDEADMQDWFSDSGDEKDAPAVVDNGGAVGQRVRKATANRRRKNPPLHEAVHHLPAQKAAFSSAWMALLLPKERAGKPKSGRSRLVGGSLSLGETHDILVRLHAQVLPHLVRPTLLHDFLVDCLAARGATALLALNGLFTLIVSHNLDYPSFYTRLYALLDASVLHVRHRARFLRLLDTFLGSTHLPASLVASFVKRLSRLALHASPAAIVAVVPFVWNLLKRHHTCLQMIHRDHEGDRLAVGPAGVEDPYDAQEPDPLKTQALSSSLWELSSFGAAEAAASNSGAAFSHGGEAHYLASTTTLARILAVTFTKERYDLEDFLDITYGTLFENETVKTLQPRDASATYANGKPRKAPPIPALVYALPEGRKGRKFEAFPVGPRDDAEAEADAEEQGATEQSMAVALGKEERFAKSQPRDGEDEEEREAREAMEELRRKEKAGESYGGPLGTARKLADPVTKLWAF